MADSEAENGLIPVNVMEVGNAHVLDQDMVIVSDGNIQNDIEETEEVTEDDILQQALQEANETFDHETVEYTTVNDVGDEVDVADQLVDNVPNGTTLIASVDDDNNYGTTTYRVVGTMPQSDAMTFSQNVNRVLVTTHDDISQQSFPEADAVASPETQVHHLQLQADSDNVEPDNDIPQGSLNVTLVPANEGSGAPLGSSQNPIRIIQQGNQYTPVQQLSGDQLSQIMQVVQQQQLAKTTTEGGGSSILYNPNTNTRIVYRVIYPSELHKGTVQGGNIQQTSQGQQTLVISSQQVGKRAYRKRNREDDEEKLDGPELSKEEKEEKKKHRPRTRSGRVSKPPKHMVKDYKHIHPLDWDEDYDDSDGGYSDFKESEHEEAEQESPKVHEDSNYIHPGLGSSKPKNWTCQTCTKSYIGRAGLGRHYRLYPLHGKIDEETENEMVPQAEESNSSLPNGINNVGSISEDSRDSNTQDSSSNISTPSVTTVPILVTNHTPRRRFRGRPPRNPESHHAKRKARLKEIVRQCEDEELMEVVLPRLAKVITMWEFLLMKVERGRPSKPHVDDIYKEFEDLYARVKKICHHYLQPLDKEDGTGTAGSPVSTLDIQNEALAQALGLNMGVYGVKDIPAHEETTFQYKLLTTDPTSLHGTANQTGVKRTVEVVTHDQLVTQQSPSKRARFNLITSAGESIISQPTTTVGRTSGSQVQSNVVTFAVNSAPSLVGSTQIQNSIISMAPVSGASHRPLGNSVEQSVSGAAGEVASSTGEQSVFIDPSSVDVVTVGVKNSGVTINGSTYVQTVVEENSVVTMKSENPPVNQDSENVDMQSTYILAASAEQMESSDQTSVQHVLVQNAEDNVISNGQEAMENGVTHILTDSQGNISEMVGDEETQLVQLTENHIISEDQLEGMEVSHGQIVTSSNIFQTADGIIIIQNPDGTTVQLQGGDGQAIPLETVQALLAMDSEGQLGMVQAVEQSELDQ